MEENYNKLKPFDGENLGNFLELLEQELSNRWQVDFFYESIDQIVLKKKSMIRIDMLENYTFPEERRMKKYATCRK